MATECLAVIPARGGSKGIPRKNLELVGGQPLVTRMIHAALAAVRVNRVIVSTDDQEIALVAEAAGAQVILRPEELAGDTASSESALLHALDQLRASESYDPDLVALLQCTSPLCLPGDIDAAIARLLDTGADSCLTVAPFHHFMWDLDGDEATGVGHDKTLRLCRQELPPRYLENGAVYVMRTEGFRTSGARFYGTTTAVVVPAARSIQIDEPADLALADALARRPGLFAEVLPDPIEALVLDFDGVFTDNRVLVLEDGTEGVLVDRSDGLGLSQLKPLLPIVVLSTEKNPVVAARCEKLGLECHQGLADKGDFLLAWLEQRGLPALHAVYVGNDINDLACVRTVGCGLAVADAHPEVIRAARHVLVSPGGHGALREVAEMLLSRLQGGP